MCIEREDNWSKSRKNNRNKPTLDPDTGEFVMDFKITE